MNDIFQFSAREQEVIELLMQGKSNKQIALGLGLSASTVEYHLNNIYKKLSVNTRTEAVLRLGKSTGGLSKGKSRESTVERIDETTDNGGQSTSTRRIPLNKYITTIGGLFIAALVTSALIVAVIGLDRPAQTEDVATANVSSLPDLTITSVYVSNTDNNGGCLPYYGFFVTVLNSGSIPAPDVFLAETNTGQQVGIGTLNPQQSITMPFVAKAENGVYSAVVDPQNAIAESNENNNNATFSEATATPSASCPPINWSESTPTPMSVSQGQAVITTALPQQYFIPMFSPPGDWIPYFNPAPVYTIFYPPTATVTVQELDPQRQAKRVVINIPVQSGTQMIDKKIIIDSHTTMTEGCYAYGNGVIQINGLSFVYQEGVFWQQISDQGRDPRDIFQSRYTSGDPENGFCYDILLEMSKHNDPSLPIPGRSDISIEILLDILSTLKFE